MRRVPSCFKNLIQVQLSFYFEFLHAHVLYTICNTNSIEFKMKQSEGNLYTLRMYEQQSVRSSRRTFCICRSRNGSSSVTCRMSTKISSRRVCPGNKLNRIYTGYIRNMGGFLPAILKDGTRGGCFDGV